MRNFICALIFSALGLMACTASVSIERSEEEETITTVTTTTDEMARVVSVAVSGSENSYTFNVGIKSPDTGCEQYANWWEVITEDGQLIYRRILGHSHVNEQPFVRSGGKVEISDDQVVIVRAHMNNLGYGVVAYTGSVSEGFKETSLALDFALDIELDDPQPGDCAF